MSKSTARPRRVTAKAKTRRAPKLGLVHGSAVSRPQLFWAVANPNGIIWPMTVACFPEIARDRLRKCWRREGPGAFDWGKLSEAGWTVVRVRLSVLPNAKVSNAHGNEAQ